MIQGDAWAKFPTEPIVILLTIAVYVLRIIEKRIASRSGYVTVVNLLRAEMKWSKLLNETARDLRLEFEAKLDKLERRLFP